MWKTHLRSHDTKSIFDCNIKLLEKYFDFPLGGGFHKAYTLEIWALHPSFLNKFTQTCIMHLC
jgi:hypothetical protein